MAGYIGSKTSVVSSGVERKKTYSITGSTTSLTGLNYTVGKVHVYQNGVRLLDGTDYTATNGTSITLTVAAQSGDNVVVVSQASFQLSESYTSTESDARYVQPTHTGNLDITGTVTADGLTVDGNPVISNFSPQLFLQTGNGNYNFQIAAQESVNNAFEISSGGTDTDASNDTYTKRLVVQNNGDISFYEDTGTTAKFFWDASAESLGIGTSSTSAKVDIVATGQALQISTVAGQSHIALTDTTNSKNAFINYNNDVLQYFGHGPTERMRIDSSGNLLVGKTSSSLATDGIEAKANGSLFVTRSSATPVSFRRSTTDGSIVNFYKDGSTVGSIGAYSSSYLYMGSTGGVDTHIGFVNGYVRPATATGAPLDNNLDLGHAVARWDDIYATNGTIQTSDFNEKQDIASLTATEMLVGKRISALFKTFRWKDSVAENGDNARTHTGVIAQDVQAAFTAEGLDAGDYALFISSTWFVDAEGNEVEEGTEGATSKTRMGIRYPELLSFVAAYNEQRFASIEARLTALEA